jgi:hypothetical protein
LVGRMKNNAWKEGWKKIRWEVKWRKKGKVGVEKEEEGGILEDFEEGRGIDGRWK